MLILTSFLLTFFVAFSAEKEGGGGDWSEWKSDTTFAKNGKVREIKMHRNRPDGSRLEYQTKIIKYDDKGVGLLGKRIHSLWYGKSSCGKEKQNQKEGVLQTLF